MLRASGRRRNGRGLECFQLDLWPPLTWIVVVVVVVAAVALGRAGIIIEKMMVAPLPGFTFNLIILDALAVLAGWLGVV